MRLTTLRRSIACVVASCLTGGTSAYGIATTATPIYNGVLRVVRSGGTIDRGTGLAEVKVRRWSWVLAPGSDGIFPDLEPIVIAIGDDNFRLEAGSLKAVGRNRKAYRYRVPRSERPERGVQSVNLRRLGDGSYRVEFTVRGVQLYELSRRAPLCLPTAFIVGDDDGFNGVTFDSPGSPPLVSRRIVAGSSTCPAEEWPWA